ncbi:MAG TPA: phage tail protein [Terriglobales bacterium]|nr:phage tail protein [Terriglobales bacterium]
MPFWLVVALFVATLVVTAALSPRPPNAKASALGDFQVPTAEDGRTIPVIAGTCIVRGPNVLWYGDLKKNALIGNPGWKRAFTLGMIFSRSQILGHQYFLGMQMGVCHGVVDELVAILVANDKPIPGVANILLSPTGETIVDISSNAARDMFGGTIKQNPGGEGGLKGRMRFYSGKPSQPANAYLGQQQGFSPAPAFGGLCHAVLEASPVTKGLPFYVGTNQYIKDWAFVLRRCPKNLGLAAGRENIAGDTNPAEWIYEIMTNTVWGRRIPAARFDLASFQAAGNTLWSESMGISQQLDNPSDLDSILGDILQHIDGAIYTDPATGLWTLKLIRADYDPGTLLELTDNDILELDFGRVSWQQTLNEVKVKFLNRATWKEEVVQAQETANHATRQEIDGEVLPYLLFSNSAVAQKVANREMRQRSYPLAKARVVANRKAWALRHGGVFKLTWAPLGISGMVMRVSNINYGALENGRIEIECVEDIFAVGSTVYDPPADSGWVDPVTDPLPPTAQRLEEVPYHLTEGGERELAALCVRAEEQSAGYQIWSDEGAGFYQSNTNGTFNPSGTLVNAYQRTTAALDTVGFVIQGAQDLAGIENTDAGGRVRGDLLVLIDDEWMSATTVTDNGDGTYTIAGIVRGIFDTLPADHSAGARVWFFSDGTGLNLAGLVRDADYPSDMTISAKCLPFSHKSTVAIGSVSAVVKTMASRAQKPYPPGKAQVNGLYWPTDVVGNAAFTWAHRIRTAQPNVVQQDAASVSGAIEGTYTVEVLLNGVVQGSRTQTGLTGTSFTYLLSEYLADAPTGKAVQFRITPVATLNGAVRTTDAFWFGGFGLNFGRNFGGTNQGG